MDKIKIIAVTDFHFANIGRKLLLIESGEVEVIEEGHCKLSCLWTNLDCFSMTLIIEDESVWSKFSEQTYNPLTIEKLYLSATI